jgi:helicase-like protein
VYLRRNEEDVLTELPEKIEVEDWVRLSAGDEQAYADAVGARSIMQMRQAAYVSPESAKLERLREICEEAAEDGLKVVVFSFFLGVLDVVGRALGPHVVGTVNGSVPPAVRQQLVDDFTRRPGHAVLLGQIEAGGVGINMQAASVVIITEPQWKPSTEHQAVARAHRMGRSAPCRCTACSRRTASMSGCERFRRTRRCCSMSSREKATRRTLIDGRRRLLSIGRPFWTTTLFHSSGESSLLSNIVWVDRSSRSVTSSTVEARPPHG